jgi:hypothetical protein
MSSPSNTSRNTYRQRVATAAGFVLERQYLYLEPHIWQGLELFMHQNNVDTISLAVKKLILDYQHPSKVQNDGSIH